MPDGTVTTDSLHERRADAVLRAKEVDVELARDTFIGPRGGRIPLADWVAIWESTHQASPATWAAYRSHLRLHILPALGQVPLHDIRRQHVKTLAIALGHAPLTPIRHRRDHGAVDDPAGSGGRPAHPLQPLPSSPHPKGIRAERPHAAAEQIAAIVDRQARTSDGLMILTAAYTGMR